ncbi:Maf family protein [Elusimicrobiota bacterium]
MINKIILASASERRINLLKEWGLKFTVCPSNIDEVSVYKKPSFIVRDIALQKAENIQRKLKNSIIISADTIVVLNGKIIGKPRSKEHSNEILQELNGSFHKVYTGVAILRNEERIVFYDVAGVQMQKLSDEKLYGITGKHMDKAGAYAVQDKNDSFVKKIYGDYFTVVGLPYNRLKKEFKKFSINLK